MIYIYHVNETGEPSRINRSNLSVVVEFFIFSQLHDFYSHVNAKQASVFQKDMKHLKQNEMKIMNIPKINDKPAPYNDKDSQSGAIIEAIKQQKLQEIMQNTDPALSTQIELLFNELSQKIYDTINQTKK